MNMERSHRACSAWRLIGLLTTSATAWVVCAQSPLPDDFNPGVSGQVYALAVQADGKILVGGSFDSLCGQPRTGLARLNPDGTLDLAFDPSPRHRVNAIVVQNDGRILVGGVFSNGDVPWEENLARLHPDGAFDIGFAGSARGEVRALALLADGKIIVAGGITSLDSSTCNFIGRLNADGSPDFGFGFDDPGGSGVLTVAVQADGKVLMGGGFCRTARGVFRCRIGRWNADGTLDLEFNPGNFSHNDASVDAIAVQVDGKILVGGTFTNMADRACYRIARLNANGSWDSSFGFGANDRVSAFALQADGKIIAAGDFTMMSGQPRNRLARFNPDGTLDDSFNPGASASVFALALQADGRLLTAGSFTNLAGQPRTSFARLEATVPATQVISRSGSDIIWLRGGTSPGAWRTVFEHSADGLNWTRLGPGSPITGSWQVTGVSSPADATIRAQAFVTSGLGNGSAGVVEDFYGPPIFVTRPLNQTNNAGTTAAFNIRAGGSVPLMLQWYKDGVALADNAKFTGTQTAALTITNSQKSDEGSYTIVLSNSFSSVTSAVVTLTVRDPGIAVPPISQIQELGQSASFSAIPTGTAPFAFQWWKDGAALPGCTGGELTLTNLLASDAGRYSIVVSNSLGCITSSVAQLTVNAAILDASFGGGTDNAWVYPVAVQTDGKILVGGEFFSIGGAARANIARLNADGLADKGFNPGADGDVYSLAIQTDGKLLVGGSFTSGPGGPPNYLVRLDLNGSWDRNFNPSPNGVLFSVAVQEDGKVLVGGMFTSLGGATRNYLGRLNRDGTLDTSFNPIVDGYVYTFAIQPDARILVGGRFTNLGGQPRMNLARLLPDGTLDASFDAGVMIENLYYTGMIDYYVAAIIVQADGRILVGGHFTTVGGQPRSNLARLDSDGSLDSSFNPDVTCNRAGTTPSVDSMVIQTDGSILLGGTFTTVAGQPRGNLARLRGDGVLDLTFNPVSSGSLSAVAVQTDGKILAGGLFSSLAGQAWKALGRLNYTVPATEDLRRDGSGITWLRGGSSPEVWRTTFEHTGDGIDWTSLGAGSRIIGGWQLTDVTPPAGGTVRARGFLASGYRNGSSWFVETLIGAPVFTTQPVSLTNNAGTAVTFSSQVAGPAPLSFQWLKDGVPLTDGAGVTGATSNTLALADVLKAAEASYCLVVTNANGSVTSLVATLTVVDPVLTSDPLSRYADPGQNMLFSVTAAGTALNYQWWKDGVALRQATEASLVLTNVQLSDAGNYRVVVSNQFGSLTSAVATLTVNLATLDSGFNPGAGGSVSAMAVQPDGKVLLGGAFTALGGQTRYRLGRLNADGTLDTGFSPQASATVHCLTVQRDGKILVGGDFGSLAGYSRSYIGRLNTNGTLDTSFTASLSSRAQAILIQPDGKIIVGGTNYVSRLNTNGTSDSSFKTTGGVNGPVTSLTFQSDGKIVAGGLFTSLRGQTRSRLGRLNADGSLDATFNPGVDKTVLALALQADGRILVGGAFTRVANQPRTNFARLYPDGTLDVDFAPAVTGSSSASIYSLAVQTDGRIVLGGLFTAVAGQPRLDCARLNPDGTIDAGFNPGANSYVYGLAIQGDGRILAGGNFTQFGGQSRSRVARLNNTEPATQELTEDGSTITWSRGGTSPEVRRTTFELATNGTNWTLLGAGIRNTSGWELAGVALPAAGSIRARGFVAGGANNGSSWFVETLLPLGATPQIILDDGGLGFGTNGFGFNLGGVPGQRVLVEISSNLVNWQPFRTNTLNTSLLYFSDSSGPNRPARFYRARLVP